MRGKSIDTEFVAEFIQNCASTNKFSPEEICEEALNKIEEIDKQLKIRLKLVDVLSFFNYKKKALPAELEPVSFSSIDKQVSVEILAIVVNSGCININEILSRFSLYGDAKKDFIYTMKQLLEAKVLYRDSGGNLALGPNYKLFNESRLQ